MKLTDVTVSFDPNALVQWDEGLRTYVAATRIAADQMAARGENAGRPRLCPDHARIENQGGPRGGDGGTVERLAVGSASSEGRGVRHFDRRRVDFGRTRP